MLKYADSIEHMQDLLHEAETDKTIQILLATAIDKSDVTQKEYRTVKAVHKAFVKKAKKNGIVPDDYDVLNGYLECPNNKILMIMLNHTAASKTPDIVVTTRKTTRNEAHLINDDTMKSRMKDIDDGVDTEHTLILCNVKNDDVNIISKHNTIAELEAAFTMEAMALGIKNPQNLFNDGLVTPTPTMSVWTAIMKK